MIRFKSYLTAALPEDVSDFTIFDSFAHPFLCVVVITVFIVAFLTPFYRVNVCLRSYTPLTKFYENGIYEMLVK